ncbi:hypothetical protein NT01EI_1739 [Edwardsiella ictaluri 93-146]|uniref:Uncharacterized protein n=1 Tax=Edwardsiella ictaluri (strain 93-146) TaxID=634503 RepID=C5BDZ8_EDWI9|nr:hypothetical protein NT01EI_1739 [Edwardsiella ictaluri 93-146]
MLKNLLFVTSYVKFYIIVPALILPPFAHRRITSAFAVSMPLG